MGNWRITFVFFLIVAAGLGISGRLFYIQVHQGGYYNALARGQQISYVTADPPRGNIFFQDKFSAANSLFLAATNKDWPLLYAIPKEITDAEFIASQLSSILGTDTADIYEKLKDPDDPYEPLAHQLDQTKVEEIAALDFSGIYTQKEQFRHYPAEELAGKVLGFVGYRGEKRIGQYGIEGFYDDVLREQGSDLILSIDYNIQFMLEKRLQETKKALDAKSAMAIVMDPRTGELIALASSDTFDPNRYSQIKDIDLFLNGATQKIFEPGSIFKPFTVAAALDVDVISPQTQYEDTGVVTIGKYSIRNAREKKYGIQTMTNVLELSLNTGAVFVERTMGHDTFRDYIDRFGFGKRTGVDLQGEAAGDIKNILYTSRDINFATASFGQGIAATPIQLISAFSAFANSGEIMRPIVVKETIGPGRNHSVQEPEVLLKPISAKTAAQVTSMLVSVVEKGHGKKAAVAGYKVAAKSGTAQIPNEYGKGYSDKTIHSIAGFAPAYNPRFVLLIKVDDPKGINFAADSVAPLFSKISEYILTYYEVPPER